MKNVLQKMHAEARQLRARRAQEAAAQSAGAGSGERGKAAPFGSAEAQAEANARAKQPATAGALDKDALIVTRLPALFPPPAGGVAHAADNPATPPPAQRVVTFPRRRPPLSLLSEDAKSFARVMASAVAGVRPPSAESRAAMLALYSATKARFPVRTAWDCWHRWCTPWVVQDPGPSTPFPLPPVVLDYIAGNICLPAGTWITQAQDFVYRPVPGTYPEVPGVQRKVTAGYDPRLGMVTFARMTHLLAERTWAGMGLKRRPDGTVTEEILVGRRAKLPGTLAGIWPGRCKSSNYVRIIHANRDVPHQLPERLERMLVPQPSLPPPSLPPLNPPRRSPPPLNLLPLKTFRTRPLLLSLLLARRRQTLPARKSASHHCPQSLRKPRPPPRRPQPPTPPQIRARPFCPCQCRARAPQPSPRTCRRARSGIPHTRGWPRGSSARRCARTCSSACWIWSTSGRSSSAPWGASQTMRRYRSRGRGTESGEEGSRCTCERWISPRRLCM